MKEQKMNCCLCENEIETEPITGYSQGHNAEPMKNGRCCDDCNETVVIRARLLLSEVKDL